MTTEKNIGVLHGDCRDLVPTLPKMPFQRVSGLWLKDRKLPEGRYQQLGLGPVTLEQSTRRPTFPQVQHRRREDVRGEDACALDGNFGSIVCEIGCLTRTHARGTGQINQ